MHFWYTKFLKFCCTPELCSGWDFYFLELWYIIISIHLAGRISISCLYHISGRIVLGIIFVSLPFYFMLNNFDLEHGEKFVFSLVLGITIFPSLVYALGFILSFRISIVVVFIFLLIAAFIMSKFKKK